MSDKIPTFPRLFLVRSLEYYGPTGAPGSHTLSSICLSWVQTYDIIEGRHVPRTVLIIIWLAARKGKVFYNNHVFLLLVHPRIGFYEPDTSSGIDCIAYTTGGLMVSCASSPVTRVLLAFGARRYVKNEAPEGRQSRIKSISFDDVTTKQGPILRIAFQAFR